MLTSNSEASNVISMLTPEVKRFLEIPLMDLINNRTGCKELARKLLAAVQDLSKLINEVKVCEPFEGKQLMLEDMKSDRKEALRQLKDIDGEVEFLDRVIHFKGGIISI